MKKILIIAFLLLILITLTACNTKGNNTENPSEDNDAPYVNNDVTFDIGETVYIVTGKGSDTIRLLPTQVRIPLSEYTIRIK